MSMFSNSKQNMNASPSDQKSREKLAGCVYEYLNFMGAKKAAELFIKEVPMDVATVQLNEPPGFLVSWWCVFWDLYNAAPERRMSNEHSAEARAFQDYLAPGMPYHPGMQPLNPGMPPGPGQNMPPGQGMGPEVGVPNFYMQQNQMRPPPQQAQLGGMSQLPGMPQQQAQSQHFMSGPRFSSRPQLRMEVNSGVPPQQQQNMNPSIHRVSPGAARMPGSGPAPPPPPNAAVPYGMRPGGPGMPPQNAGQVGPMPPHNQPRPWPPSSVSNVSGPGPSAYSTPPPGSVPPGYPPLTPSNSVTSQHPNTNTQNVLSSPVQEMPPNGTEIYGSSSNTSNTNSNNNSQSMGMPLQRMPSGQMQPQPPPPPPPAQQQQQQQQQQSFMPGQNMDLMNSQMNNVHSGGMPSASLNQSNRGGPQTPQGMPTGNGNAGGPPPPSNSEQIAGLSVNGDIDAINKPSQIQNRNADHNASSQPSNSNGNNNNANVNNTSQPQEMMGNPSGGAPFNIFPHEMSDQDEILKYKQSLQDDVHRRFEQSNARNQLTPGSSGPNSVQPSTNGSGAQGGLERPLSSGGIGVNGSSLPPPQAPCGDGQQQPPGIGTSSGPQLNDYLFQSG